jgi:hypothetical protein
MRLRILVAFIIFIGSYLPLSLILLAQNFDYDSVGRSFCWGWWGAGSNCSLPFKNAGFSVGIFLVCVVCLGVTLERFPSEVNRRGFPNRVCSDS